MNRAQTASAQLQTTSLACLPDQIYRKLRDAILTGRLQAGQRLQELNIAARLDASQAVAQQILLAMHSSGVDRNPDRLVSGRSKDVAEG